MVIFRKDRPINNSISIVYRNLSFSNPGDVEIKVTDDANPKPKPEAKPDPAHQDPAHADPAHAKPTATNGATTNGTPAKGDNKKTHQFHK